MYICVGMKCYHVYYACITAHLWRVAIKSANYRIAGTTSQINIRIENNSTLPTEILKPKGLSIMKDR